MDKLIFDCETTGNNVSKDRIIQLAIKVISEDGKILLNKSKLYNPGIPINPEATAIHGIKDEDVEDAPLFKQDAKKLKKIFENKIIITYNGMTFDLPVLMSEFDRAGVDVELSGKYIDVLKNERKLFSHTLSATYKRYTGKQLENAHDALSDVAATYEIMEYHSVELKEEEMYEDTSKMADFYGKLKYDDEGYLIFNFGKSKGNRIVDEYRYAGWVLDNPTFPTQVKKLIRAEQVKHSVKKSNNHKPAQGFYQPPRNKELWEPIDLPNDDLPF